MSATYEVPVPSTSAESLSRDQIIERHLPLVGFAANRMTALLSSCGMERDDAVAYGTKGLIAAVDNYDATKGTSFSTYAFTRIRGAIIDAARKMDLYPRSVRRRLREIESVNWELATMLGRWPTVKELSIKTGLPIEDVSALLHQHSLPMQSLDLKMSGREDDHEWEPSDPDESVDPAVVAERNAVAKLVKSAMNGLEGRDRDIIQMRYQRNLSFKSIGARLNISESRVSQLHTRILAGLRKHLQERGVAA